MRIAGTHITHHVSISVKRIERERAGVIFCHACVTAYQLCASLAIFHPGYCYLWVCRERNFACLYLYIVEVNLSQVVIVVT